MKRFKDWIITKFVDWLFYPPVRKRKTFDKITGWDDTDCYYTGEYYNIWEKKKESA
jgi:hypothetical protein